MQVVLVLAVGEQEGLGAGQLRRVEIDLDHQGRRLFVGGADGQRPPVPELFAERLHILGHEVELDAV